MTRAHMVLLLSAVLAGCTETVRLTRDPLDDLVALALTPADPTIRITDLALPHHTLQFTAMGRFGDGTTRDVTPLVQWTVDNGRLGVFDDRGLFTASNAAAGHATVMIEARGLQAMTPLTVMIDATIIDPAFPPPAANLFDPPAMVVSGDPARSPLLIYPTDGTMFPQTIASTLFQYQVGAMNDAYRIVFDSDVLHLAVETGAARWRADGSVQRLLAATGIAGPIRTEVQATSSTQVPAIVYVSNRISLEFSPDSPGGPLYFWSAAANGIMRGGIDAASSGKLYPPSSTCVGCHAASSDGAQLAMGYDNVTATGLHTIDADTLMTRLAPSSSRPMGWAAYSPDGEQIVVANNGVLTRFDTATGANLGIVPLPVMRYATHPDWSPDGAFLAVALTSSVPTNRDVKAASIVRIPYSNGTWGVPEFLVAGSAASNNYFPKWSPDGKWIAFVNATTASLGAASAQLMLVPSDGGRTRPMRLASHRVGLLDDVPDLASTMPTWAPSSNSERAWLAFVSVRPYGAVLPSAGRGQIWVTSLDLTSTDDPSAAAFWLPCQDTTVLNYNPVWAKTDSTQ